MFDSIQTDIKKIDEEEPEFCRCEEVRDAVVCGNADIAETTLGRKQQPVDILILDGKIQSF